MRVPTISYGAAVVIIAVILHYAVLPGIASCNSMSGIVSSYMSTDYALGCKLLSNLQTVAVIFEAVGVGVAIIGIIQKPKIR